MRIKKEKVKNEDVEMTDSVPLPPTSETGFSSINNNNSDLLNINKSSTSKSNYSSTNVKQEDTDDSDDSDKGVIVEAKHTAGTVRNHPSIQSPPKPPILPIATRSATTSPSIPTTTSTTTTTPTTTSASFISRIRNKDISNFLKSIHISKIPNLSTKSATRYPIRQIVTFIG
ncbi:unnamed protein product [[Candida] boidinii]|uniref:Unnamed protein product n=1 Tax=Candida boidinii TaxID=5477 RepID=A0A9W6T5K8_CANBO|nr:unnamed protein product [[Candida] boidinii]